MRVVVVVVVVSRDEDRQIREGQSETDNRILQWLHPKMSLCLFSSSLAFSSTRRSLTAS